MNIIDSYYVYGISDKKLNKYLKKIKIGKKIKDLKVVVTPLFDDGILEIYSYNQLLGPYYLSRTNDINIIGFASDTENANQLILELIQEVYTKTNGFDIKKYIKM